MNLIDQASAHLETNSSRFIGSTCYGPLVAYLTVCPHSNNGSNLTTVYTVGSDANTKASFQVLSNGTTVLRMDNDIRLPISCCNWQRVHIHCFCNGSSLDHVPLNDVQQLDQFFGCVKKNGAI